MEVVGYDKLSDGGIRYAWKFKEFNQLLESAAFDNKTKNTEQPICGYTTSVSMGCILKPMGYACKFCRTGKKLQFCQLLSAYDIAKQNIFMVLSDEKRNLKKMREFAYMGQGEPGYSYTQLRQAIKITDYVMEILNQRVYRHIISTSGVIEMLDALTDDLINEYFNSKITLHFSLHNITMRNGLMPINQVYPIENVIKKLIRISEITGEKVCIGLLLLNNFVPKGCRESYSMNEKEIKKIVSLFDKTFFRFSFCEFNESLEIGNADVFLESDVNRLCDYVSSLGYEAKLFSSFGKKESAACGMLGGEHPNSRIDTQYKKIEGYTDELLQSAIEKL